MSLIHIPFEWYRDQAGYRLVDPEPSDARPGIHPIFGPVEPSFGPVEPSLLQKIGKPQRVVPLGGERLMYRPLKKFDQLCKAFSSLKTADDVLQFIRHYGPLTHAGLDVARGEEVAHVLDHADMFRCWLDAGAHRLKQLKDWLGSEGVVLPDLQASLVVDASRMLSLRITPKSLLSGLWLQLAVMLASGEKAIRACSLCGQWFTAGRGTRRRLDARFCCDKHRILFNSLKRSEGG